jgi:hypothetical protein
MNRGGRLAMVRVVLIADPVYFMIPLDLLKWFFEALDKKRTRFLWKGQKKANWGKERVQRPIEYGVLEFITLTYLAVL